MANLEPEVKIRLIALAEDVTKVCIPSLTRGETGLAKYLEYFDKAYKAVIKTVETD
jgi:hypothetical protein